MPPVTSDIASAVGEQAARRLAGDRPAACRPRPFPRGAAPNWPSPARMARRPRGHLRALGGGTRIAGPDLGRRAPVPAHSADRRPGHAGGPGRAARPVARSPGRAAEAAEEDTAAVVTWPSRDVDGPRPWCATGSPRAPSSRRAPPAAGAGARGAGGARRADPPGRARGPRRGRPARPGDDPVRRPLRRRDRAARDTGGAAPRGGAVLAAPDPWTWLAERDGQPIGLLAARAAGARGLDRTAGARQAPVAYLDADVRRCPASGAAGSPPR